VREPVTVAGRGFEIGAAYEPARGARGFPRRLLAVSRDGHAVVTEVQGTRRDPSATRVERGGAEWFAAWAGAKVT
jgi:hypothetical protein